MEVIQNDFGWVRQQAGIPQLRAGADLIGTSPVSPGRRVDAYIEGVAALIERYRVDRYFAHRKEIEDKLAAIGRAGAEVVRPMLPLELIARRGPIGRRIIGFPSTVVNTLPLVIERADVEIIVYAIPAIGTHRKPRGGPMTS